MLLDVSHENRPSSSSSSAAALPWRLAKNLSVHYRHRLERSVSECVYRNSVIGSCVF